MFAPWNWKFLVRQCDNQLLLPSENVCRQRLRLRLERKIKQSKRVWSPATRRGWPKGFREVKAPDFLDFRHYKGGKVVTLTHRPSLPPWVFLVLIFRGRVYPRAHGSVGAYGKKSPVTPLGIDPENLRLASQCLNHYATPGPNERGKFRK
jgi:hypothetical protein